MFINNQTPPVNVLLMVELLPAVKWLADNDHQAASTALSECEYVNYAYPDETRLYVTIDMLRVFVQEDVIHSMNSTINFTNVPETHVFTPFTEVLDNQVESVHSTGSLF
jgi:hypothetical protein